VPLGPPLAGRVAAFSGDGTTLAAGDRVGNITIGDAASDSPRRVIRTGDDLTVALALDRDGTILVAVGRRSVTVWEASSGQLLARLGCEPVRAASAALAPDGRALAVGGFDGEVRIADLRSGRALVRVQALPAKVTTLTFSGDGRVLLAASHVSSVARLLDASTGRLLAELRGHEAAVQAAAFAPDGGSVATAAADGTVRLWEAATGRGVGVLRAEGLCATVLAFSADGRSLAGSGLEQTLWVWDVPGVAGPSARQVSGGRDMPDVAGSSPGPWAGEPGPSSRRVRMNGR
jgi:WD40 repeat protein